MEERWMTGASEGSPTPDEALANFAHNYRLYRQGDETYWVMQRYQQAALYAGCPTLEVLTTMIKINDEVPFSLYAKTE